MAKKTKAKKARQKKAPPSVSKILWRVTKLSLILGVIVFIALTILTNIGGNSPVLKESLEDILAEQTGYDARIETLHHMSFYPSIGIDVENVFLAPKVPQGQPYADPVIKIGRAVIAFGFFEMLFGDGDISVFKLEKVESLPGSLLGSKMMIETAELSHPEGQPPAFRARGTIDEKPLYIELGFEQKGTPVRPKYGVGAQRDILAELGDMTLSAHVKDNEETGEGITLAPVNLKRGGQSLLEGRFDAVNQGDLHWTLSGAASLIQTGSDMKPATELRIAEGLINITGALHFKTLTYAELTGDGALIKAITDIKETLSPSEEDVGIDLSGVKIDLDLDIETLSKDGFALGTVRVPLKIENSLLTATPLDGTISDGTLSGSLSMDATKSPAKLELSAKLHNIDYGKIQQRVLPQASVQSGNGDLIVNLQAKGRSGSALKEQLNGAVTFVGGKGEINAAILDAWSEGLLASMLPDVMHGDKFEVNCAVVDAELAAQTLSSKALFVDTNRVTFTGEGHYDIAGDELDLKLVPESKDVNLLDTVLAVNLTGSLESPDVAPSALDIAKKIGGLMTGAINPAFAAISLIDVGMAEDHPCKQFVIEKETLPPPESGQNNDNKAEQVQTGEESAKEESAAQ